MCEALYGFFSYFTEILFEFQERQCYHLTKQVYRKYHWKVGELSYDMKTAWATFLYLNLLCIK